MTIDHIIPKSRGGQDNPENLHVLCGACNSSKDKGTMEALSAKPKAERVVHEPAKKNRRHAAMTPVRIFMVLSIRPAAVQSPG
jgi:5-methylcytosine-specific restriction endonuclease McrA